MAAACLTHVVALSPWLSAAEGNADQKTSNEVHNLYTEA